MANELTINLSSITYVKDVYNDVISPGTLQISVTGKHAIHDDVALSTTDLSLAKGNISTIGFFYLKNKDVTNNILVGTDGTNFPFILLPGIAMFGYVNGAALHAKSAAGSPLLEYYMVEA
jgi:hypothetical protein